MSNFMRWLYVWYIKPQLEIAPKKACEECFTRREGGYTEEVQQNYEKAREFVATEAFLLGYHTGKGLLESHIRWVNG